jgi:hypothetical protein
MANQSDPAAAASTAGERVDPITQMLTVELGQHVLVVPDSVNADSVDAGQLDGEELWRCRIIMLGKRMASEHIEVLAEQYREILRRCLTAGMKVIHERALEETNKRYLEIHPDAEAFVVRPPRRAREGNQ